MKAAKLTTPSSSGRISKPWWTTNCTKAKRKYNAAHKLLQRNRDNQTAINECSAVRSDLKETTRMEKAASWRYFVSELSPSTPETKVWNTISSIDGRSKQSLPGIPLVENDQEYFTVKQKIDATVRVYATISRTKILREDSKAAHKTVRTKLQTEKEEEKAALSLDELENALKKLKKGAPGEDGVHPLALKYLTTAVRLRLLYIFNRSWNESRVPSCWRRAVIIPILKKNKPQDKIKSYRPVSLLSFTSKILETMVTRLLKTWAQLNNVIPEEQSGFQPKRSTLDVIASIAQKSFDALRKRKRTIAAVLWNNSLSSSPSFQPGVPQGSPLSPFCSCLPQPISSPTSRQQTQTPSPKPTPLKKLPQMRNASLTASVSGPEATT